MAQCAVLDMKASDFRRMALALQDVVEGSHMDHADFRVGGKKIFATLNSDETRGMVALTPDLQKAFVRDHPAMFVPASGAWGRAGSTMVELSVADTEVVGEALTCAWRAAQAAVSKTKGPPTSAFKRGRSKRGF